MAAREPDQAHQVLFKFRELLNAKKEEIGALITAEHGEDLDLSITGDTTYGRDFARYLAAELPGTESRQYA